MRKLLTLTAALFVTTLIASNSKTAEQGTPAHALTLDEVRAAYKVVADPFPVLDGKDVLVPLKIVQSITDYSDSMPVFTCTDLNGWLVRGNKWGQDLRLVATTMVPEVHNGTLYFRAVGMAGARFHPCQAKSPNTEKADHPKDVNWAQVQDMVSGDYKLSNWIDISEGPNRPCILYPKPVK